MVKTEEALAPETSRRDVPAAYVPFRTFLGAIDSLEHGIPRQIDRTIWRSQSGVVQSQIMMALRFFGLVNDEDKPTPALQRFVDQKQRRQEHIAALLRYSYRDLIDRDLTKMTPRMLDEAMEQYHVTGETKRKAVTFFLQAAKFAELPLHPLLSGQIRNTGPRKKRSRKDNGGGEEPAPPQPITSPPHGSVKTLELKSGGTLTLSISVDVFSMSSEDRKFVFGLIDRLQEYQSGVKEIQSTESESA